MRLIPLFLLFSAILLSVLISTLGSVTAAASATIATLLLNNQWIIGSNSNLAIKSTPQQPGSLLLILSSVLLILLICIKQPTVESRYSIIHKRNALSTSAATVNRSNRALSIIAEETAAHALYKLTQLQVN